MMHLKLIKQKPAHGIASTEIEAATETLKLWCGSTKLNRCCPQLCILNCAPTEIVKMRTANLGIYETKVDGEGNTPKKKAITRNRDTGRDYKKKPLIDKHAQSICLFRKMLAQETSPGAGKFEFRVCEKTVCVKAWALCNGFSPNTVIKVRSAIRSGKKVSSMRAVIKDDCSQPINMFKKLKSPQKGDKAGTIVSWVLKKAQDSSDKMPKGDHMRLPYMSLKSMFGDYEESMSRCEGSGLIASFSYFCKVWHDSDELKHIDLQRKTGDFSKCEVCLKLEEQLCKFAHRDHEGREEILKQFRGHLTLVFLERKSYYSRRYLGRLSLLTLFCLSIIVDGSTQKSMVAPRLKDHAKNHDFETIQQSITAVLVHGCGTYLYSHEPWVKKGSRLTCTVLSKTFEKLAEDIPAFKERGLPKTVFIQMDNCSGDNKNKIIFGYFLGLVESGCFDTVVVSFLLVGHTHEDVDQVFSRISEYLSTRSIYSLDEFDEYVKAAVHSTKSPNKETANVNVERISAVGDFTSVIEPNIDEKVKGIKVPCQFVFEASSDGGHRIGLMRYRSFGASPVWYPKGPQSDNVLNVYDDDEANAVVVQENEAVQLAPKLCVGLEDMYEVAKNGDPTEKNGDARENGALQPKSHSVVDTAPSLNDTTYFARGALQKMNETQESCCSYRDSPGMRLLTGNIDFDAVKNYAPLVFQNQEAIEKDISRFLKSGLLNLRVDETRVTKLSNVWAEYFASVPQTSDDYKKPFSIAWNSIRPPANSVVLPAGLVGGFKVQELVALQPNYNLQYNQIFSEGQVNPREVQRVVDGLKEAAKIRRLEKNDFVLILRDVGKGVRIKTVTEAEESLPFILCKTLESCPRHPRADATIKVQYYRQERGDPNGTFIAGIQSGAGNRAWVDNVPRKSVFLIHPEMHSNSLKLKTCTKKMILDLQVRFVFLNFASVSSLSFSCKLRSHA